MAPSDDQTLDHAALFEAAPTPYIVVDTDLVIVEANRAYCAIVGRRREDLVGRPTFEAFPTNPADPGGDGVDNLRASMERARDTGHPDTMAVQRYDIEVVGTGRFAQRYWSPMNIPVLDEDGHTTFVLHRTEDVTDYVRERAAREKDVARGEQWRRRVLEVEADLVGRARELQELNRQLRDASARERQVALALQQAMLPEPTFHGSGLDVAARYRPAEDALSVGGDWFDIVQLADEAVALAVGDVVGKGLHAAAIMGQLRSALSAATHGAAGPPEALDTLARYAHTIDGAARHRRWCRCGSTAHGRPSATAAPGTCRRSLSRRTARRPSWTGRAGRRSGPYPVT